MDENYCNFFVVEKRIKELEEEAKAAERKMLCFLTSYLLIESIFDCSKRKHVIINNIFFRFDTTIYGITNRQVRHVRHVFKSFSLLKEVSMQELRVELFISFLNFACRVVTPGKNFCRHLINATIWITKPHHSVRLTYNFKQTSSQSVIIVLSKQYFFHFSHRG